MTYSICFQKSNKWKKNKLFCFFLVRMFVFPQVSCVGQTKGEKEGGRLLQAVTGYHNEPACLLGISLSVSALQQLLNNNTQLLKCLYFLSTPLFTTPGKL